MTVRDRILAYLREHPDGADDDALTQALGLSCRQHVNQECRRLESMGTVARRRVGGKIVNFLTASAPDVGTSLPRTQRPSEATSGLSQTGMNTDEPWFWEGNIQAAVVRYLAGSSHRIVRIVDTASRETGKDIVAVTASGRELWITVKGYPKGTERTKPPTQARHWFARALFDLIAWRGESPTVGLALALPDFPTYRKLAQRILWVFPVARAEVYWVRPDGSVEAQEAKQ